jgi:hypothetical protein
MPKIDMRMFSVVVQEWEEAAHGCKGAVLKKRLPLLGISQGTFYWKRQKHFGETGRNPPTTKGQRKRPEYEDAVKKIMLRKYHPNKGVQPLTTAEAQALAAQNGCELAAAIPEGTVNRIARELGLHPRVHRRENRFEASRPNELHHVDASRSRYFQCHRHRGGELVIKLSSKNFRNRDSSELREGVWIWGLVDDFSGLRVARYCVARDETAQDGIDFLEWAWSKVEAHNPFRGLPEVLYMDQGPLSKSRAFKRFCYEVAGVRLLVHEAWRPQATGKVETGWREVWRNFETKFFWDPGWKRREFSLAELNQELAWFLQERNRRPHRRLSLSKEEAWLRVVGVMDIDLGAWSQAFHREFRTLDTAGCFDFRSQVYQAQGMPYPGGVRAEVYLGVRDGAVLVADPRDGRKYSAVPFVPIPAGEYRRGELTPLEKLQQQHSIEAAGGDACPTKPISFRPEAYSNSVHPARHMEMRDIEVDLKHFSTTKSASTPKAPPMGTKMAENKIFRRYADRVGYRDAEREQIQEGDPRLRQIRQLARAAARYSIAAVVVKARHCNSGYRVGDRFILDVDGNFLTKLCPPRLCVYLISQVPLPVALINERLGEGLDPNQFHFMHQVRCLDVGVDCGGYGEVLLEITVVPRIKGSPASIPD